MRDQLRKVEAKMSMDARVRRILGFAGVVMLAACGGDAQADGAEEAPAEGFTRIINVEVAEVRPVVFEERIRLTGTVQANRDVTVSAEESGTITEVVVDKGQRVSAGDPVLRIDDRLLRAQVDEARARASLARETWDRRRRLWEEDRVGSELAYLEARYAADQAEASLASLERRLERTVITAPIGGILDARMVELGTLVSPGTPVVRIVDLDPVKVLAGVPERYAADVRRGAEADVFFDVLEGRSFRGTVGYVGAAVDARSRTFPIELVLANPGGVVKPEMVANVSVVRRTLEGAIVVPQEAVVRKAEGYAVFVVDGTEANPTVRQKMVVLGASQSNEVVIEEGLEPGERLVVVGQQQVANGDRVRIVSGGDR